MYTFSSIRDHILNQKKLVKKCSNAATKKGLGVQDWGFGAQGFPTLRVPVFCLKLPPDVFRGLGFRGFKGFGTGPCIYYMGRESLDDQKRVWGIS